MAKKFDAKAKAKRQKVMAAGGAVILLALLVIQVPRTMKMLNASAPAAQREDFPAPVTTPGDPSVLPTPGTALPTSAPSGGGSLIDSDVPPAPESGHLVSFGRFASKDPFAEQIDEGGSPGGGSTATGGAGSAPSGGGSQDGGIVDSSGGSSGGSKPVASGSATIAVNGTEEAVSVKGEFPAGAPVFVLVSVTRTEAKIAIAGGAFASGAPTVTLRLGRAITLVNTADGVRYELKLVKTG